MVQRNVRHELKNSSGATASLRTEVIPAGNLEEFLTESARAGPGRPLQQPQPADRARGAVWAAGVMKRFHGETVMCSPPPALQRLFFPLARLAR